MEKIAILDCGGQYTKVIDRKIRELGVYTDIYPLGVQAEKLSCYDGVVLSGGPSSVWASEAPKYDPEIFRLGKPMLGICYGMQLICSNFGGQVRPGVKTEYGQMRIDLDLSCPLFAGLTEKEEVLMSHGDTVAKLPEGFTCVAKTEGAIAGVYCAEKQVVGVQFHPEVDLTVHGVEMLRNFLRGICALRETYALEDRIANAVDHIRSRVGQDGKVVVLVSGGVDSAVTAALLIKALRPDQVYGIHINHGLMRRNESELICENLRRLGLQNLRCVYAEDEFFHTPVTITNEKGETVSYPPLCQICDPEAKRAVIGELFFRVTEEEAKKLHLDFEKDFLAQGTLRPDLIESGNPDVSGYAHKIKTHHNDVGVIRRLREAGRVIETNWDWHKDEVRQVARMLGLEESIASRQPFPGPGLGVRLICAESAAPAPQAELLQELRRFVDESTGGALSVRISPVRSVGVQGDCRSYKSLACLFPTRKTDLRSVDFGAIMVLARDLPNRFPFLNRVAYCLYGQEAPEFYCAGLHISRETADLLRDLDAASAEYLSDKTIAQGFAVLFPMSSEKDKRYSCALRAVCTSDFMTARSAEPGKDFPVENLQKAVDAILKARRDEISMIFYDVTGKPPATVEWE